MTRVRAHDPAVSLDGYPTGPDQGPENPLGAAPAPGSAGEKVAVLVQRLSAWGMRRRGR